MADSIVTRTLLLTDMVGSTSIVEALGDQRSADLIAKVDRVVRDVVRQTGGLEIDKTDGFLLLFTRAADGVRCAQRIHQALEALSAEVGRPVRMRAGLHVGDIIMRQNTLEDTERGAKPIEVEGIAKPVTARIMSLAEGGQTLLTRPAQELARRAAVGDPELGPLRWADHGWYRLAGVRVPIEVFEVTAGRPRRPATSAKVRRVRRGVSRGLALVSLLVLAACGAALGWTVREAATYTTLDGPARVSLLSGELQAAYEAAWQAFGAGDLRRARERIDHVARALPGQPDVRLTQLVFAYFDEERVPSALQAEVGDALRRAWPGPDRELVGFVERWKVAGSPPGDLHRQIHDFRDRHPDHLVALLLAIELHREQARTDEIAELVDALLGSDLQMAWAWRLRADVQIGERDLEGAEATLAEGLTHFPAHPMLSRSLAALRWQRGDAEGALALVQPLLEGSDTAGTPHQRVIFALDVARSFAHVGRLRRAREMLDVAYREAGTAALSDAWADVVLADLGWAVDPDVTDGDLRAAVLARAEQGLFLPWMTDAALPRLRSYVLSARTVAAWLDGDPQTARERGAPLGEDGLDPFDARGLVRLLDDPGALRLEGLSCAGAREAAERLVHTGDVERARAAYAIAGDPACPRSDRERPGWAAAEAHMAALDLADGDLGAAAAHAAAFRALWGAADPDLPVFRAVRETERALAAPKQHRR